MTPPLDIDGNAIKGSLWASENELLRQDIARLQLSSHSDSPPSSPRELPSTPMTHDEMTHGHPSSPPAGLASTKKSGERKTKKSKDKSKDKNGLELVKDEDLKFVADLGAGNGGTVTKVWNKKRKCYMARKVSRGAV
jgi:mitogen-activated protein kinase kinase